jgi:hypothetical protein
VLIYFVNLKKALWPRYYIDCDTAVHFMKRLKDIPDGFQDLDVLETLGDAKEFESLTV